MPSPKIISFISVDELYLFISQPLVFIKSTSVPKFTAITSPTAFRLVATPSILYILFFPLDILVISTSIFANNPADFSVIHTTLSFKFISENVFLYQKYLTVFYQNYFL